MPYDGHKSMRICAVFDGKSLGVQIDHNARFRGAGGQLGVQHLVNLVKARVGCVAARLAARRNQEQQGKEREKASKEK
jgi:hypothetical protein